MWSRCCITCQRGKVHRHVVSPPGSYTLPRQTFEHVHFDLVGSLPPSRGYTYCLTCIDRFSRWPEVIPLRDIKTETVAYEFFSTGSLDLMFLRGRQWTRVDNLRVCYSENFQVFLVLNLYILHLILNQMVWLRDYTDSLRVLFALIQQIGGC
ncbi:transposon Tf2-6 polyprotein [Trichonephila clavata]|uniref:Transposon Tf2-6 polyprotein n=1 Tax=Trichonephila clavata TaxID=2740835 RepID=A0A8X6I7M6_TRICU|nr:transposon Tf2-6 polyprotein [Trichonephila clavata]